MWKAVWKANNFDRFINYAKADLLCLSSLYVKNRHKNRKPESRRHRTNGIRQGFRIASEMCTLHRLLERNVKRHNHSRRLSRVPKNTSMRNKKALRALLLPRQMSQTDRLILIYPRNRKLRAASENAVMPCAKETLRVLSLQIPRPPYSFGAF